MKNERIKAFSTQVWNLMTAKEQGHFYHDVGMDNFVELTSKLLHLEPPTDETLYAVLYEPPLDYIRDQIFDKAYELDELDEDLPRGNEMELKIGKTYKITSARDKYATCLAQITPDRALFVSQDFGMTSFVFWHYKIVDEDSIEACCGDYYFELKDALEELV